MYKDFKIKKIQEINGLIQIEYNTFDDLRGLLFTTYLKSEFDYIFNDLQFVHDKFALNKTKGTLRGIHGDAKSWKLVTVLAGSAHQVVVDNRITSSTYEKVYECRISDCKPLGLLIPPGCGNGFQTLEDKTLYHYKLSYEGQYNDVSEQFTLPWNSTKYKINWPVPDPILSDRDRNATN
jgi:dTDP-4-dehydrorhamnose 3,5-epimerase